MERITLCLLLIYGFMGLVNGAQFLNATLVLELPPAAVMSPVTRTYASE